MPGLHGFGNRRERNQSACFEAGVASVRVHRALETFNNTGKSSACTALFVSPFFTPVRAAVVIEPVSAGSLRKTGIFVDTDDTFNDLHLNFGGPRVRRRNRKREKPG